MLIWLLLILFVAAGIYFTRNSTTNNTSSSSIIIAALVAAFKNVPKLPVSSDFFKDSKFPIISNAYYITGAVSVFEKFNLSCAMSILGGGVGAENVNTSAENTGKEFENASLATNGNNPAIFDSVANLKLKGTVYLRAVIESEFSSLITPMFGDAVQKNYHLENSKIINQQNFTMATYGEMLIVANKKQVLVLKNDKIIDQCDNLDRTIVERDFVSKGSLFNFAIFEKEGFFMKKNDKVVSYGSFSTPALASVQKYWEKRGVKVFNTHWERESFIKVLDFTTLNGYINRTLAGVKYLMFRAANYVYAAKKMDAEDVP